jgi:hypothetical protein
MLFCFAKLMAQDKFGLERLFALRFAPALLAAASFGCRGMNILAQRA